MSKGISSYGNKSAVIRRRLLQPEANRGLGYWAAVDAKVRIAKEKRNAKKRK